MRSRRETAVDESRKQMADRAAGGSKLATHQGD